MKNTRISTVYLSLVFVVNTTFGQNEPLKVDFRYAPVEWQTSICLVDDWQKTLVLKDGTLAYDYANDKGFKTKITFDLNAPAGWVKQNLDSPKTPIVITEWQNQSIKMTQKAFALPIESGGNPNIRTDAVEINIENISSQDLKINPVIKIQSDKEITMNPDNMGFRIGDTIQVISQSRILGIQKKDAEQVAQLDPVLIEKGDLKRLSYTVTNAKNKGTSLPRVFIDSDAEKKAREYWKSVSLPYNCFKIPDAAIQNQIDSCVRNIYQAREIKKELPAFQVGPTCYRGLWVVDGSFIMEAVAYLGRMTEARKGIEYLLSFQKEDGSFMLIDGHWKETGIVLWAVTRHVRLSNDKEWLNAQWPKLQKGYAYIKKMRTLPDAKSPNAGLIPDGFSDGGLADKVPEYTNIYWTLAGLKAAAEASRWLEHAEESVEWQKEYNDFYNTFRKAAVRDTRTDAAGNKYLPIRMNKPDEVLPQKAQWAFLHSVFPGKLYEPGDALVKGNMAMLKTNEKEGLVLDTGWLKGGVWNYFASFYGHAWLWLGDGKKASQILYDFANHASPLFVWREEQNLAGDKPAFVGDMPHNWASAEFIRLVRHCLILERENELHLLEGLPPEWVKIGNPLKTTQVETDFGPVTLTLDADKSGKFVKVFVEGAKRNPPVRIIVHTQGINGKANLVDITKNKEATIPIQ